MSSSAADYEYECTLPLSSSSNHNARKRSSSWWMVPHIDSDHGNHNAFGTDATSATSTTSNTDAHVNGRTRTSTTCNCTNNADAKRMKLHHHAAAAAATDAHDSSFQSSAECNSNFVTHRTPPPVRPRRSFHRFGGTGSSSTRSRGTGSSIRFGLRRPPSLRFSPKSVDPGSFVIPFPDLNGEVTNNNNSNNNNSNNGGHDSDQENASRSRHNRYAPPARPLPLRLRLHTDDIPPVMLFQED